MAKYYINQYIKNIAKKNTNTTEKELDDVEKELDKLANRLLEEGINPFHSNNRAAIMPQGQFDSISEKEEQQLTIIKQDDNYQYAILLFPQKPEDSFNAILINGEHLNYFNNKFIKYSTKDFIISSLMYYILNHNNIDSEFADKSPNEIVNIIENNLALNNFKFISDDYILNDIDLIDFNTHTGLLFNENETKRIFDKEIGDNFEITFNIEGISNYISENVTSRIDGNIYKILKKEQLN